MKPEDLAILLSKPGYAIDAQNPRMRQHRVVQKQQDDLRTEGPATNANHRPKKAKGNGKLHPRYRVTAKFLVSDMRHRDVDGMFTSVLDSLVRAAGRFMALDSEAGRK